MVSGEGGTKLTKEETISPKPTSWGPRSLNNVLFIARAQPWQGYLFCTWPNGSLKGYSHESNDRFWFLLWQSVVFMERYHAKLELLNCRLIEKQ